VVSCNIDNASRCRSTEDGAVNSNTAGAVNATLKKNTFQQLMSIRVSKTYEIPCGIIGASIS
jgi:hypothetical protein